MRAQEGSYNTETELMALAKELVQLCQSQKNILILLNGPMGAGKTTLVKKVMELLGAGAEVQSPTYSIHHSYTTAVGPVHHFDLYRIESVQEIETTGLWEILKLPEIMFVEWAERLPENYWKSNKLTVVLNMRMPKREYSLTHFFDEDRRK